MNTLVLSKSELKHHGVLGMKWGVRKYQNRDGSLTALGKRLKSEKEMLNVYDTLQKQDVTLSAGSKMYRVYEDDYSVPIGKRTYTSLLPSENSYYVVTMSKYANKQPYAVELETTKSLKVPSIDKALEIAAKAAIQNEDFFKNYSYDTFSAGQKESVAKDIMALAATRPALMEKISSAYKKEGYNVALDFNSQSSSSKGVSRPSTIILDQSTLKISSAPIEKINVQLINAALDELRLNPKAMDKAKKWLATQGV